MTDDLVKKILESLTPEQKQELIAGALKPEPPKEAPAPPKATSQDDNFVATIKDQPMETRRGGVPVNEVSNRSNGFVDDGEEAKHVETPTFKPTERKRAAYKPVEQKCERCDKVLTVNPVHKREYFVCDKCLAK